MARTGSATIGRDMPSRSEGGVTGRILSYIRSRKDLATAADQETEALLLVRTFEETFRGWFWSTDADGRITYLSESMSKRLGLDPGAVLGSRLADMFVEADEDVDARRKLPLLLARQTSFDRAVLRSATADPHCWSVSGSPQFDRAGRFTGYRGSAIDVTEQRKSSRRASQLAKYDSLTGLPNRRSMTEFLDAALSAAEHQKRPCAIMLIDLDRFKQVNDTLGHPAGDTLLKQVSERLLRIVGDKEKVFRLGGDEFQVVLPNCEDRGIIGDMASDIIFSLSQPYSVDGSRCIIGASIGVAVAPVDGKTKEDLIRNADLALYASKSNGRGRFRFFSSELLQAAEDRRMLEEDLRDALAADQISLLYQPIVDLRTNRMTGVEALMRWEHPTRGAIPPSLFVPIAEEANLIGSLGEWALRKACEDAATWPGNLRVAVNVSPLQFMNDGLPAIVMSALATSGLAPEQLELEITEGVFLGESTETDTMFATLKDIGVRLALDDFGTGYSSLGYLRTAPFDKIKMDQSFVRQATLPGSRNSAIIAAIVALADAVDMETTAEGIEFMDQLNLVRSLGVSHAQGWVYSKAVSCAELCERLAGGDWTIEPSGPAKQRSERQAMYRQVGVIHGNRYGTALIRNLSESGALIEGLDAVAPESLVVVDFGDGQLAFARVIRSRGQQHGIAFERQLVSDGNGGLCTSHRVSPYLLSTVGLPTADNPERGEGDPEDPVPLEELAKRLGLTLAPRPEGQDGSGTAAGKIDPKDLVPTFRHLSGRYLESLDGDEQGRESARRDLRNHVLPRFGQLRLDQVSKADILAWLAAKVKIEDLPPGTDARLHGLLNQMWTLAIQLGMPGAEPNPLEGLAWYGRRTDREEALTVAEAELLIAAARTSHNPQLKFIVILLILTGARQGELLKAKWEHIDRDAGIWRIPMSASGKVRQVRLSQATIAVLDQLPRWDGCPYLLANPRRRKPYRSVAQSWDVTRTRAGLPYVEIDDLRYADVRYEGVQNRLVEMILDGPEGPGGNEAPAGDEEERAAALIQAA